MSRTGSVGRFVPALLAAILFAGAAVVVVTALRSNGNPRADEAEALARDIWRAAGVEDDQIASATVSHATYEQNLRCVDLDKADRWATKAEQRIGPGLIGRDDLVDAVKTLLIERGFEVRLYVSPASGTRHLLAANVEGEQLVELYAERGGGASSRVLAGPCAARFDQPPRSPYVEDHDG